LALFALESRRMTMTSKPALDQVTAANPLAQLRAARRKPVAAIIGATAGLVPVGVYEVGHYELTSWSPIDCPKAMIVYAGLLFSALTVLGWSTNMFGSKSKALGFTLLLEGIMMTSSAAWLTAIALTYLVLINAVANGCRLALRDADPIGADPIGVGPIGVDWPANLAQTIAVAAGATAALAKKPTKARRRRRAEARRAQPQLALVSPPLWS